MSRRMAAIILAVVAALVFLGLAPVRDVEGGFGIAMIILIPFIALGVVVLVIWSAYRLVRPKRRPAP